MATSRCPAAFPIPASCTGCRRTELYGIRASDRMMCSFQAGVKGSRRMPRHLRRRAAALSPLSLRALTGRTLLKVGRSEIDVCGSSRRPGRRRCQGADPAGRALLLLARDCSSAGGLGFPILLTGVPVRLFVGDDRAEDHHDAEVMDQAGRKWPAGGCGRRGSRHAHHWAPSEIKAGCSTWTSRHLAPARAVSSFSWPGRQSPWFRPVGGARVAARLVRGSRRCRSSARRAQRRFVPGRGSAPGSGNRRPTH
jgi:hypothetical protein